MLVVLNLDIQKWPRSCYSINSRNGLSYVKESSNSKRQIDKKEQAIATSNYREIENKHIQEMVSDKYKGFIDECQCYLIGGIYLKSIYVNFKESYFGKSGTIASDTEIPGCTWQYVNNNGTGGYSATV